MLPYVQRRALHWRANLRLTALLLALWALVSFAGVYWAHALSFPFLGGPISFWMVSQGSVLFFIAEVIFYSWYMRRLDKRLGLADPPDEGDA